MYLAGYRFNEVWSLLAMAGPRTETGGDHAGEVEALINVNVFADIGPVQVPGETKLTK